MRTFDVAPLYRSTVGFDRLFSMLDQAARLEPSTQQWPPYDIEKVGEDAYRITMAVAGFTLDDLEIEIQDQALTVRGRQGEKADDDTNTHYLHRGIATRAFERRFHLAEHIRVAGAKLENGLLHVELVREVPEALRPRLIKIDAGEGAGAKVIEAETPARSTATAKAAKTKAA